MKLHPTATVGLGRAVTFAAVLLAVAGVGCTGEVDPMTTGDADVPNMPPDNTDPDGGLIGEFPDGSTPPVETPFPAEAELAGGGGLRIVPTDAPAASGVIDPVSTAYQYAPELLLIDGQYYFWDCWGVSGDYIGFKTSPTLAGFTDQGMWPSLTPIGDENHTCDPSVVRGADGNYYLHYSYLPTGKATWGGVAVATSPRGPWLRLNATVGSPDLSALQGPFNYGRGQTSVARGHDGAYYMLFTNQIEPLEARSIVLLRSPDAGFQRDVSEVTRYNPDIIGGWSADLSYDPASRHYIIAVPGDGRTRLHTINTNFQIDGLIELASAYQHKESQSILSNEYGEVVRINGQMVIASGQPGPRDNDWATSPATGPMAWESHYVTLSGVLGAQDFESGGSEGWTSYAGANIVNYEATNAVSGTRLLAFNAGAGSGSIQRDYGIGISAGSSWMSTARVTGETGTASGTYCMWFMGITGNESACVPYSVTNGAWTTVTVIGRANGEHNVVRAEFYPSSGTTRIDNARTEAVVTGQTFESGTSEGWGVLDAANMVNYEAPTSYAGTRLLAFNAGSGSGTGSVINDLGIAIPHGSTWAASAMVRAEGGTAAGSFCLWLVGVSANDQTCVSYSVTDKGWTRLDITATAAAGIHNLARVQFYPSEGTTRIDNTFVR